MSLTRRNLFLTGAALLLPRRSRSADPASKLITLSPWPTDLEMPVQGFIDEITPIDDFFVRCHTYTPKVESATWKLEVGGEVEHPLTFTLSELKELPKAEMVSVLECAGNGRAFYEPHMAGAQWRFGSVGNASWAGVRLRDVLAKAG